MSRATEPKNSVLSNRLLIRRVTTVKAIRVFNNNKPEIVGYRADCNHSSPPEVKTFPLSKWGAIAYELAEDWALNHKCRGDYNHSAITTAMQVIANAPTRKLHSVSS